MLKNQDIVQQLEQKLKDFKPADYDLSAQLKSIDAFEAKGVGDPWASNVEQRLSSCDKQVKSAEEAEKHISEEMSKLEATLQDIEGARPFNELTVGLISFLFRIAVHSSIGRRRGQSGTQG